MRQVTRPHKDQSNHFEKHFCPLPAWWLLQGGQTRSHPELGRQTPSRQWYYVSRPGRVGRCQACQGHKVQILFTTKQNKRALPPQNGAPFRSLKMLKAKQRTKKVDAGWSSHPIKRKRRWVWKRPGFCRMQKVDAGWSSPVSRQAHNLKVTGSNPVPATKS